MNKSMLFAHSGPKLLNSHNDVIREARLLQVFPVDLQDLSQPFLDYDTDKGKYELPKRGKYLLLLFLKEHEDYTTDLNLFTTLRSYTPEKHKFYTSAIGEEFNMIVIPEGPNKCP